VLPRANDLFLTRTLVGALEETGVLAGDPIIVSSYTEPSLVFRLGGDVRLVDTLDIASALDARQGPLLVLLDTERWGELPETEFAAAERVFLRLEADACALYAVNGFNYSRGDPTSIMIFRIGACEESESQP